MRSLSTEQILLLLVLVGIPLLRAFWRGLQELRRLARRSPGAAEPAPPEARVAPRPPGKPGGRRPGTRPTGPARPVAVPPPTRPPRAQPKPALPQALVGPRGSMTPRQAFVWKAILDPPPALPADSDRR
jgi:hypothetical protein